MRIYLSNVSCKYGAPMGRPSAKLNGEKLRLQQIILNTGGYDSGGAYWGWDKMLYVAEDSDGDRQYFRASSRKEAKEKLREEYPDCRFYR